MISLGNLPFYLRNLFFVTRVVAVQPLSCLALCSTWTAVHQAPLSFTVSQSLFKLRSIEPVMPYNHLILCCPLLLPPSIFPSIRVISNESALHIRWPSGASSPILPMNIQSKGLISFRTKGFDLLPVQKWKWKSLSHVMSDCSRPHGLHSPWNSLG